ncbi:MAG: hypothetical protein OXG35_04165, partial [Acidobacteria bacterium]|nr:hypothetical protein [Acidobacteriota bacterium]
MNAGPSPRLAAGAPRARCKAGFHHGLRVTTMWSRMLSCGVLAACLLAACGSPPAGVDDAELLPVEL